MESMKVEKSHSKLNLASSGLDTYLQNRELKELFDRGIWTSFLCSIHILSCN